MKLRVELLNAESREVLEIFEFESPYGVFKVIKEAIYRYSGALSRGSFGRGWNYSDVGYTRVDGKGHIERFKKYQTTDHWNVYVGGKLMVPDVTLRKDAMDICDKLVKQMEIPRDFNGEFTGPSTSWGSTLGRSS